MNRKKLTTIIASLMLVGLLAGCTSSEERQDKYFTRAQELFDSGDLKKAKLEVRNVLQINANHPQARYLYALILEREQNWREMFGNLSLAVEFDPEYVDARIKLGQLYYRSQAYDQALEQADEVLRVAPNNADAHTLRGSVLYRQGDSAAAIEEAQLALNAQPGHVGAISIFTEVYKGEDPGQALAVIGEGMEQQTQNATLQLLKISVLEQQGDTEGIINEYKALIAEYPENLFFHYRLVKFYEQQDRIDEAEELLRDIVKTKPENLQLKLWLAEFLANQRNLELAQATVKEFIEKQPDIYQLRFALAKINMALRQYPEAEQVYGQVIELDAEGEDSLNARNQLVKLYLAQGQREKADAMLEDIFAIEQDNTEALITTARLKMAEKDTDAAIANLRTVIKNNPKSEEALLLLAQAHESTGSRDLALDNYRNAMAVAPGNEQAVINTARLLLLRDEFEPADQLLVNYLNSHPQHTQASQLLVESYSKRQRFEDALAVATDLEQNPNTRALALYLQGRLYFAMEKYPEAESKFAEALQLEPSAIEGLAYLVGSYRAQGKEEEAYQYLLNHIKQYPDQAHAHEQLGTLENGRGNRASAIASYQAALAVAPNRLTSLILLGQTYVAEDRRQDAVELYDQAMEALPNNLQLKFLAAGVHESMGDDHVAADLYESVLVIDPSSKLAANNLAMLLVDKMPSDNNFKRALELAEILQDSKEPVLLDTLGWIYYRTGEYAQALPFLEEAVEKAGSVDVYQYHLGMTAYRLGDTEKAKDAMQAALNANPKIIDNEEMRDVVIKLKLENQ